MKVSEAIELLDGYVYEEKPCPVGLVVEAIRLGIEALKRHRNRDYLTYNELHQGLPGETPEEEVTHDSA